MAGRVTHGIFESPGSIIPLWHITSIRRQGGYVVVYTTGSDKPIHISEEDAALLTDALKTIAVEVSK